MFSCITAPDWRKGVFSMVKFVFHIPDSMHDPVFPFSKYISSFTLRMNIPLLDLQQLLLTFTENGIHQAAQCCFS